MTFSVTTGDPITLSLPAVGRVAFISRRLIAVKIREAMSSFASDGFGRTGGQPAGNRLAF